MSDGTLKYCQVYISIPFEASYSRQLCFSVYDEPYEYQTIDFKWDETHNKYFKAMISDDFYENEDLLLRFVHSAISVYPNAKIWTEEDWFYTFEDLDRIVKDPNNTEWCYKKPS